MIWGRARTLSKFVTVDREPWPLWWAWYPIRLMDGRWVWREWVEHADYWSTDVPYGASRMSRNRCYRLAKIKFVEG